MTQLADFCVKRVPVETMDKVVPLHEAGRGY
jgi:hypothetical protein